MQDWLQSQQLTLDDFEELVYEKLLTAKLADEICSEQVGAYFAEHWMNYSQAIIYEIVLTDKDLIQELFYALQEREISFTEIARQYGQSLELRRSGGYRGTVTRQDLPPAISAAVFAANPPTLLKPITTPHGIHLIYVEELINLELNGEIRSQILMMLFSNWLDRQMEQVLHHQPLVS